MKKIKYLGITPFCNGLNAFFSLKGFHREIWGAQSTSEKTLEFLNSHEVENIFFNNSCGLFISDELKEVMSSRGIKYSCPEAGWFPHRGIWGFTSGGWLFESDLAKQSLSGVTVDFSQVAPERNRIKPRSSGFNLSKKFVLLVLQYTRDASIIYGYPDFPGWESVISEVRAKLHKDLFLVVKQHPQNLRGTPPKLPGNCLLIEDGKHNAALLEKCVGVVGVNSTMLYEASLLYNKPVLALGRSWFDSHPQVATPIKLGDPLIFEEPTPSDKLYRLKMFSAFRERQTIKSLPFIKEVIRLHKQVYAAS